MRCYKILVNNKVLFELNKTNLYAPRIRFQIQAFKDNYGLAFIDIFNIELSNFTGGAKALLNKSIELYAWIESTPMNQLIGYKKELNTCIYKGYVGNVIPNYNFGKETCLTIAMIQKDIKANKKIESQKILFKVSKGSLVVSEVKRVLSLLYPNSKVSVAMTQMQSIYSFISKITMQQVIDSIDSLINLLQNFKNNNNYLRIYKGVYNELIIGLNDFKDNDLPLYYDFNINATDLLEQPQFLDYNTIQLSTRISGKYQPCKTLRLPNNMALNISSISTRVPYFSDAGDLFNKLFFNGNFIINEVWHIGDSHNIQAQQWATNLKATCLLNL